MIDTTREALLLDYIMGYTPIIMRYIFEEPYYYYSNESQDRC